VQLLGGEAGRRLAQEQTEAVAAVLAWLAAHPPVFAAAGSAATGAIGQPSGEKRRCLPGCGLFGPPSSLR
jgi:ABC-type sugar transport system substrate-binding protein